MGEIDSFVVSGDSNGDVILWDKKSGNSLKTFSELKGDVLALAINQDQKIIYASGVDSKVICLRQVSVSNKQKHYNPKIIGHNSHEREGSDRDWVYSGNTRGQSHDIKSLVYLERHQCIISGGVATDLCIYSLEKYGKLQDSFKLKRSNKKFLHIPPFELKNQVTVCTDLATSNKKSESSSWQNEGIMILVLRKTFSIELWMYEKLKQPVFLLEFEKKEYGITSVCSNTSATFLCISDAESTTFYKINIGVDEVNLVKINSEKHDALTGVIYSKFINNTVLTFNNKGDICYSKINEQDDEISVTVEKTVRLEPDEEDMGKYS